MPDIDLEAVKRRLAELQDEIDMEEETIIIYDALLQDAIEQEKEKRILEEETSE